PTSGLAFNACLSSVTGVVNYFFDYQILNTADSDIQVAGSAAACPAPENTAQLCSDSIDNDGNGFGDCMDNNCIVNVGTCRATTTIAAIDQAADANPAMPTLPAGAPVGVIIGNGGNADVYVTAVGPKDIWVATNKAAGPDGGLDVYMGGATIPSGVVVGAKVNVIGSLKAYNNDTQGESLPELEGLQVNVSAAPSGQAPSGAAIASVATLNCASTGGSMCSPDTGRPYVGSLVTLTSVQVTTANDPANHNIGKLTQTVGCTGTDCAFEVEADTMMVGKQGCTYTTITGIWTYDVYNNVYALEPTAMTPGTGC
ncbi:MAG: hypothetical protein ACM31C_13715, partial [Acidobacteriota bacterium]